MLTVTPTADPDFDLHVHQILEAQREAESQICEDLIAERLADCDPEQTIMPLSNTMFCEYWDDLVQEGFDPMAVTMLLAAGRADEAKQMADKARDVLLTRAVAEYQRTRRR